MPKTKQTTLDSLTQTNGKISTNIPSTLDAVMSEGMGGRYTDISEESYSQKLNEMNLPELQSLAHEKGVMVLEEPQRMRNELLKEFRSFVRAQTCPPQPIDKRTKKISKEALAILNEGK